MARYDKINSFDRKFHPAITIISFCAPATIVRSLSFFISAWLIIFYEYEYGLSFFIISAIYIGISIISILIRPFLGYLSDRNFTFTRKFGRRFPWILTTGLIFPIIVILLFIPHLTIGGDLVVAIFLFINLIIHNIASAIYSLSYSASLLAKFRHPKERLIIATIIEFFGISIMLITNFALPLIINLSGMLYYSIVVLTLSIIFIVTLFGGIPGLLEEEGLIQTYYNPELKPQDSFFIDFFKRFKVFKQKNFLILLIQWIALAIFNYFISTMLYYYIDSILEMSPLFLSILSITYYIMMIIGVQMGFLISWFAGHKTTWIISGFILGGGVINLFYISDIFLTLFIIAVLGFAIGLGSVALIPLTGDVFDENAVRERKRSEGFNYGILTFFGMLTPLISPLITIYLEMIIGPIDPLSPTPLEILGIKISIAVIPSIIIITSTILFLIFYDLNPEKTTKIQEELKRLQI